MSAGTALQKPRRTREPVRGGTMSVDAGAATLASTVHRRLRQDILAGELAPDTKLRVQAIAERYHAGASPIREALNRLLSEGLVAQRDQRGFVVASVSIEDLRELVGTRCAVEGIAFAQSIEARTVEWEERVVLTLHRLSRMPHFIDGGINPAWEAPHHAFHDALISNCGSKHLRRICAELRDQSDRYRNLASVVFKERQAEAEHQAMAAAAIDGKRSEAVELLTGHLRRTLAVIEQHYVDRLR